MTKPKLVTVLDQKTGEILAKDVLYKPQAKVSASQREGFIKKENRKVDRRHFAFADMENLREVISVLSNVHLGYLLHLQCFIDYESQYLHNHDGKEMTKKTDIQKALGVSKETNKRLCKALETNGILEKNDGRYRINPKFHFKGKNKNRKVVKLFTTTLKRLCNVLSANELGFLYKLLPYVHFETNMICINPFEKEPQKVEFLNVKGIAEVTGLHEDNISLLLTSLRKGRIIVETIREDKRNKYFTLNPYIFYRKSGQPDNTLKGLFASSPYSPKK
ncbi:replication/maintenance protein RepL [Cytobacillus oceanisediminis]|uniref:replication/maintenance protein RepL n=1 Tax=Cytobacillus oceanisediminis TaxID=665099 RepID=UPI001C2275BE|nr:replication/maintenance protein RepL [Cytobacillus oceanisediminis]MBU8768767.1 replication/maintenance protein RepL [Cytobacillus oceanisediminis]